MALRMRRDFFDCPSSDWQLPLSFATSRHTELIEGAKFEDQTWRMKERMKTVSVALVLCLNVGVDPPDLVKTQPCARVESWIDPQVMSTQKALEAIGISLQKQYERWQPRARYKQSLDPTVEDIKKLCTSLRRNAKEERVLFHYNGHGVPRPTANGEIWVFNKTYTQYIPLSVYDLQTWMGSPSIFVYDCSNAGVIVDLFRQFAEQHEKAPDDNKMAPTTATSPLPNNLSASIRNCIQLAACKADEMLPMNPDLPADIFTACLTTPIKIALRWFVLQNTSKLVPNITLELLDKIPGQLNDRRTMIGELNWIFTAITDTIAWNVLPRELFQKLFRQDLLVASLFRNFLLAERIMRSYDCTPVSCPVLPSTAEHPLWNSWDLCLDLCLSQLPAVLECEDAYTNSPFFEAQLTAFGVWLDMKVERRNPPEQLPIVLQVLLSTVHRLRALELLNRFLDLGPWAVNLSLLVGIYPYMLKLLQSSAREIRYLLVFIWSKILAVDSSCQVDLVREGGYKYFLQVLHDNTVQPEHRTMAAFAMAVIVRDYPPGQEAALQSNLVSICLEQMNDSHGPLRLWVALCLGNLWQRYDKAKWCGVRDSAHEKLYTLLVDKDPEVRAATVYALGTFMNPEIDRTEHAMNIGQSVALTLFTVVSQDMSPLVRKELVNALQWVIIAFEKYFLSVATQDTKTSFPSVSEDEAPPHAVLKRNSSKDRLKLFFPPMSTLSPPTPNGGSIIVESMEGNGRDTPDRLKRVPSSSSISSSGSSSAAVSVGYGSFYSKLWLGLASLQLDPYPSVAHMAHTIMDYIREQVYDWPRFKEDYVEGPSSLGALYNVRDSVMGKEWCDKAKSNVFSSLPPSPSNRSYLSVDSPPNNTMYLGSSMDLNKMHSRGRFSLPYRRTMPNMISENASDDDVKDLVTTKFVDWCCKRFNERSFSNTKQHDTESSQYFAKEWRYSRNKQLRAEANEDCTRAHQFRIENQIFSTRLIPQPSGVMMFHPYDNHFITATKEAFVVWDYDTNTKLSHWSPERGTWNRIGSRLTTVDIINAHDENSLLVCGSEDGCVRVWSNYKNSLNNEPFLVSAWQAFSDAVVVRSSATPFLNTGYTGFKIAWEQRSQSLIVGGNSRVIRIWNAETEFKLQDVVTGSDSSLNCISVDPAGSGNIFAGGFADGSVRIFDRRLPASHCRTMAYREQTAPIVGVKMRDCTRDSLITGCNNGEVRMYDIRNKDSDHIVRFPGRLSVFDAHRTADIIVCGGSNQLKVYDLRGTVLNPTRNYDWFMAPKTIPSTAISYATFHPYRVMLGYISAETILVSNLDSNKK